MRLSGDEVRAAEMDASEVHSSIPVLSATNSTAQGNRTSAAKRCRGRGGVFYPVAVPFPVATGAGFRRPPMTAGQPMMYGQPMMAGHPMMMGHNMMWG